MNMEQLSFKIPVFEGPLDLLLHLISKHKLNINDIPISVLVDQYLEYIGNMAALDMEIAGEFMEMAARLIYIKTVSLLPKYEEAEVLKKELEGRLIEYSVCKQAAAVLKERYNGGIIVKKPMHIDIDMTYTLLHSPEMLREAYLSINFRKADNGSVTEAAFTKIVAKRYVPVTAKIVYVLKKLYICGKCSLEGLFDEIQGRSDRVAAFLAVLELAKTGRILLNDDNTEMTFNRDFKGGNENIVSDFDSPEQQDESDQEVRSKK